MPVRMWTTLVIVAASLLFGCSRDLDKYVLDEEDVKIPKPLNTEFDKQVRLLGYSVYPPPPLAAGQQVSVTLYWKAEKDLDPGWQLFTHVVDAEGQQKLNLDSEGPLRRPVRSNGPQPLPPGAWIPGKVYVDPVTFQVPENLPGDNIRFVAGIWKDDKPGIGTRLDIVQGESDNAQRAVVATLPLAELTQDPPQQERIAKLPEEATSRFIDFGGKLHLLGYQVQPAGLAEPASQLEVTFYFRAISPLDPRWKIRSDLHALGGASLGRILQLGPTPEAKEDEQPRVPPQGPSDWQTGHLYSVSQSFKVPNTSAPRIHMALAVNAGRTHLPVLSGPQDPHLGAIVFALETGVKPQAKRKPTGKEAERDEPADKEG